MDPDPFTLLFLQRRQIFYIFFSHPSMMFYQLLKSYLFTLNPRLTPALYIIFWFIAFFMHFKDSSFFFKSVNWKGFNIPFIFFLRLEWRLCTPWTQTSNWFFCIPQHPSSLLSDHTASCGSRCKCLNNPTLEKRNILVLKYFFKNIF